MKILLHSKGGDALALGLRLQAEGHDVGLFIRSEKAHTIGRGLIYHVEDFVTAADRADLILFDQVGEGSLADKLRAEGKNVLGGGKFLDVFELDRLKGLHIAEAAGFRVPEYEEFPDADFERAIQFVERDGGRWVFKASENIASDKTYPAEDAEAMVAYLEHLDATMEAEEGKRPAFILQRFVEGVETSIERCYAAGQPVPTWTNSTWEEKKFLVGGLGPAVGCAGNLVHPHEDATLVARSVGLLDVLAAEHELTSMLDVNVIVATADHWPYFLEATCRPGYDAFQAHLQGWAVPLGETLAAIAGGDVPIIRYRAPYSAAVRVSVPPYPCGDPKQAQGVRVMDEILDDAQCWPGDVMLDAHGELVVSGADGVVYVVCGTGETPERAFAECYRWLADARLPDRQYRTDLTETTTKRLAQLRTWGYLRGGSARERRTA